MQLQTCQSISIHDIDRRQICPYALHIMMQINAIQDNVNQMKTRAMRTDIITAGFATARTCCWLQILPVEAPEMYPETSCLEAVALLYIQVQFTTSFDLASGPTSQMIAVSCIVKCSVVSAVLPKPFGIPPEWVYVFGKHTCHKAMSSMPGILKRFHKSFDTRKKRAWATGAHYNQTVRTMHCAKYGHAPTTIIHTGVSKKQLPPT